MSTIRKTTRARINITQTKEKIFQVIADHEGTSNWVQDVKAVNLLQVGAEEPNGIGAIREVLFKPALWTDIKEEITAFEAPTFYQYKIVEGMPGLVDHLGTWSLAVEDNGDVTVSWEVFFEFKTLHWFAPFVGNFATSFNQVQHRALRSLKAFIEGGGSGQLT